MHGLHSQPFAGLQVFKHSLKDREYYNDKEKINQLFIKSN